MAKITEFNVPYKLTREGAEVKIEVFYDKKEFLKDLNTVVETGQDVLRKAGEISQFNSNEVMIAKSTLLLHEETCDGFLSYQVLVD